jgi:hypothetical protein
MTLKAIDETFDLPEINNANDLFNYLADYNDFKFYETDLNGVVPNEIPYGYFMVNKLDLISPVLSTQELKNDGFLFIGIPSEIGTDIDGSVGQFDNVIKDLISKSFLKLLPRYINCKYQFQINNVRPLYNTVKYTKATNCTGIEINYSLWI